MFFTFLNALYKLHKYSKIIYKRSSKVWKKSKNEKLIFLCDIPRWHISWPIYMSYMLGFPDWRWELERRISPPLSSKFVFSSFTKNFPGGLIQPTKFSSHPSNIYIYIYILYIHMCMCIYIYVYIYITNYSK